MFTTVKTFSFSIYLDFDLATLPRVLHFTITKMLRRMGKVNASAVIWAVIFITGWDDFIPAVGKPLDDENGLYSVHLSALYNNRESLANTLSLQDQLSVGHGEEWTEDASCDLGSGSLRGDVLWLLSVDCVSISLMLQNPSGVRVCWSVLGQAGVLPARYQSA